MQSGLASKLSATGLQGKSRNALLLLLPRRLPRHRLLPWKLQQARQPAFAVVAVAAAPSVLTLPAEAVPA